MARVFALVALPLALSPAAWAHLSPQVAAQARKLLATQVAPKVPGLAAAVAIEGRVVWSETFGFADLATKRPATATTRFRIGSISKSLTAACLLRLVERGAIDLDVAVQRYVPEFPVKPEGAITIRLLAGHLAGIRHYRKEEPFLDRPFANVRAGLQLFANDPLVAAPGTRFSYSSFGWTLISAAIESAAHRDFLDCMQAEVIAPLGLEHTRPDRAGVADADRTAFYAPGKHGEFVAAPVVDSSYMWAGGGFLSSAEDLVRFASALLRPGYLSEDARRQLFTSQKTKDGKATGYGIGWFVTQGGDGRAIWYHDGGQHGGTAVLLIRPQSHVVAAILCNVSGADIDGEAMQLADLFGSPGCKQVLRAER